MKIASWNIEWMNRWFTSDSGAPAWRNSSQVRGVTDLQDLARRVASVITAMDPDVLCIQEGPSRASELKLFIDDHLGGNYDIVGPSGTEQQRLYALIKKGGAVQSFERAFANGEVDLEEPWSVDIDGCALHGEFKLESYGFTRDPLLVDVSDGRTNIRLMNLHLKSKFVQNARQLWRNPATRPSFIVDAVLVRRRISAEATRIREYLNELLEENEGRAIVICGDFNDGPGSDFFERLYLTHNLVSSVAGSPMAPRRMMRHGFADRVRKEDNYTAIFNDFIDEIPKRKVLLDHILVSPGLYWNLKYGTVDHAAFDAAVDDTKPGFREKHPSDHRPQWVEF